MTGPKGHGSLLEENYSKLFGIYHPKKASLFEFFRSMCRLALFLKAIATSGQHHDNRSCLFFFFFGIKYLV